MPLSASVSHAVSHYRQRKDLDANVAFWLDFVAASLLHLHSLRGEAAALRLVAVEGAQASKTQHARHRRND